MTNREKYFHVACLAYALTATGALVAMSHSLGEIRGRISESLSCDAFRAERTERVLKQLQQQGAQHGVRKLGV